MVLAVLHMSFVCLDMSWRMICSMISLDTEVSLIGQLFQMTFSTVFKNGHNIPFFPVAGDFTWVPWLFKDDGESLSFYKSWNFVLLGVCIQKMFMEFEHLNIFSYYYFITSNKICGKKSVLKEFTCSVLIIGMFMGNGTKKCSQTHL